MTDSDIPQGVIVTAFIDLSLDSKVPRRSKHEYQSLGEYVLSLQLPLVVFCDKNLETYIQSRRQELAPNCLTITNSFDIQNTWIKEWEQVDHLLTTTPRAACIANAAKDTTEYVFLGWSKWHWLKAASQLIAAHAYWWIDFGITHVATPVKNLELSLEHAWLGLPNSSAIVVSLEKDDKFIHRNIFSDYMSRSASGDSDILRNGTPIAVGGIFGIHTQHVSDWCDEMEELRTNALSRDIVVSDEMLLSWYAAAHSDKVHRIASNYQNLLDDVTQDLSIVLKQLASDSSIIELPNMCGEGWSAMNPSIASDSQGGFRAIVRHVNYAYINEQYVTYAESDIITTRNFLLELDEKFEIVTAQEINDDACRDDPVFPVHGLEDLRLFMVDNEWFASGTIRQHRPDGLCEIMVVHLQNNTVTSSSLLPSPFPSRHEKNWTPLHHHDQLCWLWSVDPPVVITIDSVTNSIVISPSLSGPPSVNERGGSQAIPWGNGWLCITHHVRWLKNRRQYRQRMAFFARDFSQVTMSRPFIFEHVGIEFCAGLATTSSGVVVSYGIEDSHAHLMPLHTEVIDLLLGVH
jgi:hypothetical protein